MKKLLISDWPSPFASLGLLILRITFGIGLVLHGWPKIQKPFSWMGPESWAPGGMQALGAVTEVIGGLALAIGLLTPLASIMIASMMCIAGITVHIAAGQPFVAKGGQPSWELAALYFAAAVALLTVGPGRFSMDYFLFGRRRPEIDVRG